MAYDEGLSQRIREILEENPLELVEKKMFGGLAFMVNGHMCVGVVNTLLMARVGASQYEESLALPHAREMDFTGKALKGFIYVDEAGIESDEELRFWIDRSLDFVQSLPPKSK